MDTAQKDTAGEKTTTESVRPAWATPKESVSKPQQEPPTKAQRTKQKSVK